MSLTDYLDWMSSKDIREIFISYLDCAIQIGIHYHNLHRSPPRNCIWLDEWISLSEAIDTVNIRMIEQLTQLKTRFPYDLESPINFNHSIGSWRWLFRRGLKMVQLNESKVPGPHWDFIDIWLRYWCVNTPLFLQDDLREIRRIRQGIPPNDNGVGFWWLDVALFWNLVPLGLLLPHERVYAAMQAIQSKNRAHLWTLYQHFPQALFSGSVVVPSVYLANENISAEDVQDACLDRLSWYSRTECVARMITMMLPFVIGMHMIGTPAWTMFALFNAWDISYGVGILYHGSRKDLPKVIACHKAIKQNSLLRPAVLSLVPKLWSKLFANG